MNTSLREEDCLDLAKVMSLKYAAMIGSRRFYINTRNENGGAYVCVRLQNEDETFYYPVEARMAFSEDSSLSEKATSMLLIDSIDAYFEEYLREDESVFIPIEWKDYEIDGHRIEMRGQVLNRHAEKLADAILASAEATTH